MAIQVDKDAARLILISAFKQRALETDEIAKSIETVLRGTHKTFRYVLVTALISKATNNSVDPLSLQAQDNSNGAYDARSIAHEVLVPFERDFLPYSLGGSNEPYLNKPARFPRLSKDNPVRRGNDQLMLEMTIGILSQIDSSSTAFKYLKTALAVMEQISIDVNKKYEIDLLSLKANNQLQTILDYIWDLSSKSCEGETCALIVSTIERFYCPKDFKVIAHKVNESGTSSKEVGDIDIFDAKDNIVCSIEVKDKNFTKEDVQHAIVKFQDAKLSRSLFIYGKTVSFDKTEVFQLAARYGRIGTYCSVISILDYAKLRLLSFGNLTLGDFVNELLKQAKAINAKDETIDWIKLTAQQ